MLFRNERKQLKILLLQLQRRSSVLHISLDGKFGKKGRKDSKTIAQQVTEQVAKDITAFRWVKVPRALMAVTMTFFPGEDSTPAVHNLVKFCLDELRQSVFTDDRQVGFLRAESWARTFHMSGVEAEDSKLHIRVERLADYKRKFDLYFHLIRDDYFRAYVDSYDSELLDTIDDEEWERNNFSLREMPEMDEKFNAFVRRHNQEERQKQLLSLNRIQAEDRPGLPRWAKVKRSDFDYFKKIQPFAIDLGTLPKKGESEVYKNGIREALKNLKSQYSVFDRLVVPVDINVEVSARLRAVSKDLDNIMRDIAPIFEEEFFAESAYLHGYRIYVAENMKEGVKNDLLRLKLLPMYEASAFETRVEKALELGKEWVGRKLAS